MTNPYLEKQYPKKQQLRSTSPGLQKIKEVQDKRAMYVGSNFYPVN